ncbi:FemAB family XrtA/PEP-CTERM system-associated protein [uncultured Desulfobacter sp.]|uniref:FemAB family XrtA/PEP-CTERM system-associated protein n=1 Tax=uncultured Desulfobacter sp. TaxID=240139 RepID=UPI0029F4672F|nr:FemAB family XrtA/PEP-CTERM system-associated protein [uncultured Desulfobacter sp.]
MISEDKQKIKICLVDDSFEARWNNFVTKHPRASHCHLFAWKKVILDTYNQPAYYFCAQRNDLLVGVLPLIHIKSPIFSSSLVSMPYLSYGGALVQEREAERLLMDAAVDLAGKLKVKLVDLRDKPFNNLEISTSELMEHEKVRMVKSLPDSGVKLLNSFPSKLRSQIKRPLKAGMTFSIGGREFVDAFYDVFKVNMRDLGSPVHSKLFFKKIFEHFTDKARIGIVKYNKIIVAAGVIISYKGEVEIPWASSLRQYNRFSPNMLLYSSLLEYCCDQKMDIFDFGRSTPGEGTYKFKKQWGSKPEPLAWQALHVEKNQNRKKYKDSSNKDKMQPFIRLWQKLPVSVATTVGPLVRGGISN